MEAPVTSVRSAQSVEADNVLAGSPPSKEHGALEAYWAQVRHDLTFGRLLRLGTIVIELTLVAVAVRLLNIESPAFESVLTLALGGFLIHHFLPVPWRISFFAALSVATVPLVFGWQAGTWLLAFGGLLIALCHIPVAFHVRVALIVALALALAVARKQMLPAFAAIPPTIWPILGSMFMFRLIVYLYDLKHEAAPFSASRAVAYFFMLPSVCMPLFPVVDYKTFQRSFYNADPLAPLPNGCEVDPARADPPALYKAVYFLAVIEPGGVVTGTDAARYMVSTFLLYLKISGLFHIIVGLLHLYGFGLAETHHFYLFSSSFTDFWRRINIYWKDFIQKIVFNPAYFRLRKRGETFAVATATLIAFVGDMASPLLPVVLDQRRLPDRVGRHRVLVRIGIGRLGKRAAGIPKRAPEDADQARADIPVRCHACREDGGHVHRDLRALDHLEHARCGGAHDSLASHPQLGSGGCPDSPWHSGSRGRPGRHIPEQEARDVRNGNRRR